MLDCLTLWRAASQTCNEVFSLVKSICRHTGSDICEKLSRRIWKHGTSGWRPQVASHGPVMMNPRKEHLIWHMKSHWCSWCIISFPFSLKLWWQNSSLPLTYQSLAVVAWRILCHDRASFTQGYPIVQIPHHGIVCQAGVKSVDILTLDGQEHEHWEIIYGTWHFEICWRICGRWAETSQYTRTNMSTRILKSHSVRCQFLRIPIFGQLSCWQRCWNKHTTNSSMIHDVIIW